MKTNGIQAGVTGVTRVTGMTGVAGLLASFVLASMASAGTCPPEECGGSVAEVAVELNPIRFVHALATAPARNIDGNPLQSDVVKWQPESKVRSRTVTKSGPGESGAYVIANDGNTVALTIENGKVVRLDHNGTKIPPERVKKAGNKVTILGDSGETVYEFDLGEDAAPDAPGKRVIMRGQAGTPAQGFQSFRYPGADARGLAEMKMEAPKAMIGVQLGEPNGMLLGHFGLKAGEATMVTGVYEGLPAAKAGVKPYDLIVAVNGETPAGQTHLRETLREMEPGAKVRMTVIHQGERKDVSLTLVGYDEGALAESKLDAVAPDAMAFAFGAGNGENVFVAPGVGQLRNMPGQDAEKWREFAESWRAQAEEYAKGFAVPGAPAAPDAFAAPALPGAPAMPRGAVGSGASDARWQRIEERLERLEQMLQRLSERHGGGAGAGGG